MSDARLRPVVLTIAGSDSGGGAGIQADLKAIAAMGAWGATAVTCLTSQNLDGVRSVQPTDPAILADQIDAVREGFPVRAVKTGMLYSSELIQIVVDRTTHHPPVPLVVDPVMVATSGARLLRDDAAATLRDHLLPLATLVTPNLHEAAILAAREVRSVPEMRDAAVAINQLGGAAVLVKGGHLAGDAVDVLFDGEQFHELHARRIPSSGADHGTGCTLASAIAAGLALGLGLPDAVSAAKRLLTDALLNRCNLGDGIEALDLFWRVGVRGTVMTL
jgi:hydroxymethylpyrimidine kinase/phosphomethylpyrimidine kinase